MTFLLALPTSASGSDDHIMAISDAIGCSNCLLKPFDGRRRDPGNEGRIDLRQTEPDP
jgi:hypothetical protein